MQSPFSGSARGRKGNPAISQRVVSGSVVQGGMALEDSPVDDHLAAGPQGGLIDPRRRSAGRRHRGPRVPRLIGETAGIEITGCRDLAVSSPDDQFATRPDDTAERSAG